jgi:metal-sulfur cluster biosynthetic enzyme
MALSEDGVWEALKVVVDPEINMNIVDLGLIYEIDISENNDILVKMTLTSPGCPFGPQIVQQTTDVLDSQENVGETEVEIVWDPPWGPDKMSEEARMIFGY